MAKSGASTGNIEYIPAAEPEQSSRWYRVSQRAGRIALGALRVTGPPLMGVAAASWIALQPAEAELGIPGLTAEASIQTADYSTAQYGPTRFGLEGPGSHITILGQDLGINLNITKLDTSTYRADPEQSVAGFIGSGSSTEGEQKFEGVIVNSMERQMGFGAGVGLGIFAGLFTGLKAWRRKHEKRRSETAARLAAVNDRFELLDRFLGDKDEDDPEYKEFFQMLRSDYADKKSLEEKSDKRWHRLARKLGTTAVAVLPIIASETVIAVGYDSLQPPESSRHHLSDMLGKTSMGKQALQDFPILNQIFITGDAGYYSSQAVTAALGYINRNTMAWKSYGDYFAQNEVPKLKTIIPQELQNNPDIVRITLVTDSHDNRLELKEALPTLLEGLGTDLVLNLGDQESTGGHSFLDYGAWLRAADALPKDKLTGITIPERMVAGNHDHDNYKDVNNVKFTAKDGTQYQPIIPLDKQNNYSSEFDGITIVGSPDLNSTGVNGTSPKSSKDQLANDAKQGEILAQRACEIYQTTGKKPIVITHEQWASFKALAEGCVSFTASGHGHKQMPLKAIKNADGSIAFQWTIGSVSGDGPNNAAAIVNLPTIPGFIVTLLYSKELNAPLGALVTTVYPSQMPTVEYVAMPGADEAEPMLQDPDMYSFLQAHDPKQLQELEMQRAQRQAQMVAGN